MNGILEVTREGDFIFWLLAIKRDDGFVFFEPIKGILQH